MRRRVHFLFLALIGATLIAAACGDDDSAGEDLTAVRAILADQGVQPASDDDLLYYDAVLGALDLAEGQYPQFALERSGVSESLEAAREAGAGMIYLAPIERLRAIDVPPHYETDHARLVVLYEELSALDAVAGGAVEDDDLMLLRQTGTNIARTFAESLRDFSRTLCVVLTIDAQALRSTYCSA